MSADELESLYDQHADALFAFALNLTRHEADSRDILHDVFQRLAQQFVSATAIRQPRSFLLSLVYHRVIDLSRRTEARQRYQSSFASETLDLFAPTESPDDTTFRIELDLSLASLPLDQRTVVHLKLWEHFTFEEISTLLSIPLNTATSRYRYGLEKMRASLRPLYDEIRR